MRGGHGAAPRPSIHPDDGVRQGLASDRVPSDSSFTLVCDAQPLGHGRSTPQRSLGLAHRRLNAGLGVGDDLSRVVLTWSLKNVSSHIHGICVFLSLVSPNKKNKYIAIYNALLVFLAVFQVDF